MFTKTIGILGGGQLGKMTALAAQNWDVPIRFLDKDRDFPAGKVCPDFVEGDFKDYDAVMAFGQGCDIISIEIEAVNTQALKDLKAQGKTVHPCPEALETIQDKGLQKLFYQKEGIPTAPFVLVEDWAEANALMQAGQCHYPFVQKARRGGYDGKGVALIQQASDVEDLWMDTPSVLEVKADIDKELAVIVARNEKGEIAVYPTVEMVFSETAHLVEYLSAPAKITPEQEQTAQELAKKVIHAFGMCGLLAVEMFLTKSGDIWVNEVAPRPHNSGHHTIDACMTSQYEQLIRAISNRSLGSTRMTQPAIMLNLLGDAQHQGAVCYEGLDECLALEGVKIHLYGKATTKPFRKMGHVTIVDHDPLRLLDKARIVRNSLRVVSR